MVSDTCGLTRICNREINACPISFRSQWARSKIVINGYFRSFHGPSTSSSNQHEIGKACKLMFYPSKATDEPFLIFSSRILRAQVCQRLKKHLLFWGFFVRPGPPLRLYLDIFHISIIIKNKHANLDDDSKKHKFNIAFPIRLGAQNPRFWTILPLEVPILARY